MDAENHQEQASETCEARSTGNNTTTTTTAYRRHAHHKEKSSVAGDSNSLAHSSVSDQSRDISESKTTGDSCNTSDPDACGDSSIIDNSSANGHENQGEYVKNNQRVSESRADHCGGFDSDTDSDTHSGKDRKTEQGPDTLRDILLQPFGGRTWERLVRLLCRPTDPALLGLCRFLFGFLMIIDTLEERGMASADYRWGDPTQCRFPLINWWKPLPLQWMYIVYTVQLTSAVCLMFGLAYRVSCPTFMCCYWYILLLEKSDWNNHSYLFGLCAFLFTISDGNRYWSIDALINPKIRNAHVPSWNYVLFRAQIFLVYFIAGLKKLDQDWVMGYSMQHLSEHAAFDPFRLFLTSSQIDHFVVHLGGLMIDLSVGFLLLHEESRPWGLAISTLFNTLNSLIFSIGMFPYGMMCMQLIFCSQNLPKEILASLRLITRDYREGDCQPSHHCVYTKEHATSLASRCSSPCKEQVLPTQPNRRHRLVSAFTLAFIAWQCFLPYSHGITKGYNNWTNGMYGYSWDMMVHNWHVQHIRITYKDKDTNETGYIDPRVWTSGSTRWSGHVDMVKQYAHCIERNLKDYNITNIEIYFDIWRSLNQRFQQRLVDPTVDVLQAEWHPFQQTTWMMPLIVNKTSWRERMNELDKVMNEDRTDENYTSTVFVADFPGMNLESYVDKDFGNTSLHVLEGEVIVEILDEGKNYLLKAEESMQIPADGYHNVHTVSSTPSSYMYTFINTTDVEFMEKLNRIEDEAKTSNKTVNETLAEHNDSYILNLWNEAELQEAKLETEDSVIYGLKNALWKKFSALRRSLHLGPGAVYCLITNSSFSDFLNSWYPRDLD